MHGGLLCITLRLSVRDYLSHLYFSHRDTSYVAALSKILLMEHILLCAILLDTCRWAHINVKLHFFCAALSFIQGCTDELSEFLFTFTFCKHRPVRNI